MASVIFCTRVAITKSRKRVVKTCIVIFLLLLVISHNIVQNQRVIATHSVTEPDGTVSNLSVQFYQTNIGIGSLYLGRYHTGVSVEAETGRFIKSEEQIFVAVEDLIANSGWAPIRRDDLLVKWITRIQILLPALISVVLLVFFLLDRKRLRAANVCLSCSYSLAGLDVNRCPECGTKLT